MDLTIIDNFLPNEIFFRLKETIYSNQHPWFFLDTSTGYDNNLIEYYTFGCYIVKISNPEVYNPIISSSKYVKILNEHVKQKFGFSTVLRSRLDMTTYRSKKVTFQPHVDLIQKHYTSIFYLTECDAPTIIYNEKHFSDELIDAEQLSIMQEVCPKENRIIIFDGNYIHTGTSATDVSRRILVNSNYI